MIEDRTTVTSNTSNNNGYNTYIQDLARRAGHALRQALRGGLYDVTCIWLNTVVLYRVSDHNIIS